MTVNTSSTHEFSIQQVVTAAYRIVGLLSPYQSLSEPLARVAREELEIILKALHAKGIPARSVAEVQVTLEPGVNTYQLPTNVLDTIGPGMLDAGGGVATPVSQINSGAWQGLTTKAATGVPVHYYAHRSGAQVEVRYWPVPGAGTVTHRVQRLFADATDGNATLDLERPWTEYVQYALAHKLCMANSQPLQKCQYFDMLASRSLRECIGFGNEHAEDQIVLDHPTRWSR